MNKFEPFFNKQLNCSNHFVQTQKKELKNTKSELQGLENTTGWLCIYFATWFLFFQNEHGFGSLVHFWIRIGLVFCIFEILGSYFFFKFCIFEIFGLYFFCALHFWEFAVVFILFFSVFFGQNAKNRKKINTKRYIHYIHLVFLSSCQFPLLNAMA